MKYEIYCDEAYPDLFTSNRPHAQNVVIGGLWLESDSRKSLKAQIHSIRDEFKVGPEFKWNKVSPANVDFYAALIDLMFVNQPQVRFRSIVVDHQRVDFQKYHQGDRELGFYKFYYLMLKHWIGPGNSYSVFCDQKTNHAPRYEILAEFLRKTNPLASVDRVQAVHSKESVLIQLADVLIGAVAARMNDRLRSGSAKEKLVEAIESRLGRRIAACPPFEKKFNVWVIEL